MLESVLTDRFFKIMTIRGTDTKLSYSYATYDTGTYQMVRFGTFADSTNVVIYFAQRSGITRYYDAEIYAIKIL